MLRPDDLIGRLSVPLRLLDLTPGGRLTCRETGSRPCLAFAFNIAVRTCSDFECARLVLVERVHF